MSTNAEFTKKKKLILSYLQPDEEERIREAADVQDDLLVSLYHLDIDQSSSKGKAKRSRKNNPGNPNDLDFLGEDCPGSAILTKGIKNPKDDLRIEGTPVGLKNLGATCYMNSLLQSLFMNTKFRKGVYDWTGSENEEKGILYELQLLFASLQHGMRRYYDPTPFTNKLDLRVEIQQDAQEFYKALITYLEDKFEKSTNLEVRNLIREQFQGKCEYVTTCSNCHTPSTRSSYFYEIEIHLAGIKMLEEGIAKYIAEEELTGPNQYMCDKCNAKHDATRAIRLTALPEVLNFQLMRFLFDCKTGKKRKVRSSLAFPKSLDMRKFLAPEEVKENEGDYVYELSSVLIHKGASAYGGHYIGIIRDEETGQWWRFDDDKTSNVGKDIFKTLIDTQKEETVASADHDDYDGTDSDEKGSSTKRRTRKNSKSSKDKRKQYDDADEIVIDEEEPLPQGYMRSTNAYMLSYSKRKTPVKASPPETALVKVEELNAKLMEECANFNSDEQARKAQQQEFEKLFFELWSKIRVQDPEGESPLSTPARWIATDWLCRFVKGDVGENSATCNSDLICEHNGISFFQINKMKRISPEVWDYFKTHYQCGPELTEAMYCRECVSAVLNEDRAIKADQEMKEQLLGTALKNFNPKPGDEAYWVSSEWLRRFKRSKRISNTLSVKINDDVFCHHGALTPDTKQLTVIPPAAWNYLKQKFPDALECSYINNKDEFCPECTASLRQQEEEEAAERERRKQERSEFKDLLMRVKAANKQGSTPSISFCKQPQYNGTYYLIQKDWALRWAEFIEFGLLEPGDIDNSTMLCPHGKLIFEFETLINNPENNHFVVVDEDTWNKLKKRYNPNTTISFRVHGPHEPKKSKNRKKKQDSDSEDDSVIELEESLLIPPDIAVCDDCIKRITAEREYEQSHFVKKTLHVEVHDIRGRGRASTSSRRRLPRHEIHQVNHTDTVSTFQLRIFECTNIPPNEQQLWYKDQFMEPHKQLSDYGIKAGDTITLNRIEPQEMDIDYADLITNHSEVGVGFSSTALSATRKKAAEKPLDDAVVEVVDQPTEANCTSNGIEADSWACTMCTFVNPSTRSKCEMCDTFRDEVNEVIGKKRKVSPSDIDCDRPSPKRIKNEEEVPN